METVLSHEQHINHVLSHLSEIDTVVTTVEMKVVVTVINMFPLLPNPVWRQMNASNVRFPDFQYSNQGNILFIPPFNFNNYCDINDIQLF